MQKKWWIQAKTWSWVSGEEESSWARLGKFITPPTPLLPQCITSNLHHAWIILTLKAVTISDLGVNTDSYLKLSAHCAVASKKKSTKCCESSGGLLWKGQLLFCHFTNPRHAPILHTVLVSGRLQQLAKGNWCGEGNGAAASYKKMLPRWGRRKLNPKCSFKVCRNH